MRLSDIKGERVFDVIAEIIGPVANIAATPAAAELWKREPLPEGCDVKKELARRVKESIPALLRTNKGELVTIMAAISGEAREEYLAKLDMLRLLRDMTELLTDESFIGLFTSAHPYAPDARGGALSGAARENTPEG